MLYVLNFWGYIKITIIYPQKSKIINLEITNKIYDIKKTKTELV